MTHIPSSLGSMDAGSMSQHMLLSLRSREPKLNSFVSAADQRRRISSV